MPLEFVTVILDGKRKQVRIDNKTPDEQAAYVAQAVNAHRLSHDPDESESEDEGGRVFRGGRHRPEAPGLKRRIRERVERDRKGGGKRARRS